MGNGDTCPLFPDHGTMLVLQGKVPMQFCPHQTHDGVWVEGSQTPPSRSKWPLHGFEESVATYFARLDKAIREAALPDLSGVSL